jgi:hypothetical protein
MEDHLLSQILELLKCWSNRSISRMPAQWQSKRGKWRDGAHKSISQIVAVFTWYRRYCDDESLEETGHCSCL